MNNDCINLKDLAVVLDNNWSIKSSSGRETPPLYSHCNTTNVHSLEMVVIDNSEKIVWNSVLLSYAPDMSTIGCGQTVTAFLPHCLLPEPLRWSQRVTTVITVWGIPNYDCGLYIVATHWYSWPFVLLVGLLMLLWLANCVACYLMEPEDNGTWRYSYYCNLPISVVLFIEVVRWTMD